jgi:hypothetical protein
MARSPLAKVACRKFINHSHYMSNIVPRQRDSKALRCMNSALTLYSNEVLMSLNLDQTLSWKDAHAATTPEAAGELAMLNDLQGNIQKAHGRDFTSNLFVSFDRNRQDAARKFVGRLGDDVNAALDQLLCGGSIQKSARERRTRARN